MGNEDQYKEQIPPLKSDPHIILQMPFVSKRRNYSPVELQLC
jgi:hypothetical protein